MDIIKAGEQQVQVMEWTVQASQWTLQDSTDSSSVAGEKLECFCDGIVRWDPFGERYLAEFDSVINWKDGLAPFLAAKRAFSYDGRVFRSWERAVPGTEQPSQDVRASGAISLASDEAGGDTFNDAWLTDLGIAFMPPYFFTFVRPPSPLSALLESQQAEGHPVNVLEVNNEVWRITTTMYFDDGDPFELRLWYHPSKGCVIRAEWVSGTPDVIWKRYEADTVEVDNNVWVPREFRLIKTLSSPPTMRQISLDNFTIDPEPEDAEFVLAFPPGTRVDDFIEGRSYLVGVGLNQEPTEVQAFIDQHGLAAAYDANDRRGSLSWLLWANLVAIVSAIIAYLLLRRRPTKG